MVEYAPSTGGLALWVRHDDLPRRLAPQRTRRRVATDGHTIFYGAALRDAAARRAGRLGRARGAAHRAAPPAALRSSCSSLIGDVDLQLFNICADAIVNSTLAHLSWLQLPGGAVRLERAAGARAGHRAAGRAVAARMGRRAAVPRHRRPRAPVAGAARGAPGRRATPSTGAARRARTSARAPTQRARARRRRRARRPAARRRRRRARPKRRPKQAREWSERIAARARRRRRALDAAHAASPTCRARARPGSRCCARSSRAACRRSPALSWSRPSRSYLANQGRGGAAPAHALGARLQRARKSVPRLVVIVDVSGSIDDALMERFAREIEAITRRLEAGADAGDRRRPGAARRSASSPAASRPARASRSTAAAAPTSRRCSRRPTATAPTSASC